MTEQILSDERLATRHQCRQHKIDHLLERGPGLVGALRDHLRMEEPHHRGADAHRRLRHVIDRELAGRGAVGDDRADGLGHPLHMGDADLPALLHCDLDHLVQLGIADIALAVHAVDRGQKLAQP